MPAVSKAQRRAMAIAAHDPDSLYARNSGLLGMSREELSHYSGTAEKGLPERKGGRDVAGKGKGKSGKKGKSKGKGKGC